MVLLRSGTTSLLSFSGALDARAVRRCRDDVEAVVRESPRDVIVDITKVDSLDGSGVALIVALVRRIRLCGGKASVCGIRGQPARLLELLGIRSAIAA